MDEKEIYVILNPQAAKGKARRQEEAIREAMGNNTTMVVTVEAGGAEGLAYQAALDRWPIVVAAGGDGTVNEVVNGIMRAFAAGAPKPTLGIIPVGRGNDFAWVMKIPTEIEAAVALIRSGKSKNIDLATVHGGNYPEGRWFVNGLGIGFEPLVNFAASKFKRISGTLSYMLALAQVMINYPKPYDLEVELDGERLEVKSQQLSVCNGRRMGSAFLMAPEALCDDGLLDVVYTNRPLRPGKFIPIAKKILDGSQLGLEEFTFTRVKEARFKSRDHLLPVHIDGEEVSRGCEEISIKIYEGAISIFA
ncbi:MAG: diacylglycerol kinase family lipid kinase [Spirochaetales bacterium]|jgi:diacylglycerol kinase (ATP)|nr:diacylglycerol kinase family lipid kinase [Spirochaetales bacterium]